MLFGGFGGKLFCRGEVYGRGSNAEVGLHGEAECLWYGPTTLGEESQQVGHLVALSMRNDVWVKKRCWFCFVFHSGLIYDGLWFLLVV